MISMHELALCSGIGGISLGLGLAIGVEHRTVCHVERDAYAASVLVARMENKALDKSPIWDSLETFDGAAWRGVVDIVTAGYPCQPHSVAGKRLGAADERNLWPEVARIIGEVEPRYAFIENVPGAMRFTWDHVIPDLRRMGYSVKAGLFSAEECGATHRRQRLFVLGHRTCNRSDGRVLPIRPRGPRETQTYADGAGDLADTRCRRQDGDERRRSSRQGGAGEADSCGDGAVVADTAGERLEGQRAGERTDQQLPWPPGPQSNEWRRVPETLEPAFRRVADGVPNELDTDWKERISALGNAVVPAVAAKAFRHLTEELAAGG